MKKTVLVLILFTISLLCASLVLAEEKPLAAPKVLDKETIFTAKRLSNYDTLVVKNFSIDQAQVSNISDNAMPEYRSLKPKLVNALAEEVVRQLNSKKLFKNIKRGGEAGGNAIILEGKFTEVNAGSRAARFFVGYGAGSSKVVVQGRLLDAATGKELAVFENNRHSPFSAAGFERVLTEDSKNLGKDIAEFIGKLY